ncbi:MAG: DUF899 domain-containing protein [Armatimonadetes bacterium]|nr:DUF899 domain-containing protein [Armatimonadota bacterium]MBS1701582.1 DUF899 domain-containing protein [Armatimonadota bacterium]MBS1725673.1 DUF899 domain-containing protein [Armatimonadota bacterium]
MTTDTIAHPPIASKEEWLEARRKLLVKEKDLTRQKDRLAAERRRMPMVKIDKNYEFEGPEGKVTLEDLFAGQRQLIVYHFMYGPDWEKGCPGCTGFVNEIGDLSTLHKRNTNFVLISRAPLAKLEAYKNEKGWTIPWYSSLGSEFNYDFQVTHDPEVAPPDYNFVGTEVFLANRPAEMPFGEAPGLSVFFRTDDGVYHTYSTYARGVECLTDTYAMLDVTPYGRQEDWEDSPEGWPQNPTYG